MRQVACLLPSLELQYLVPTRLLAGKHVRSVMINLDYPAMLDPIKPHLATKRTESASFLIWYLEN